MSGTGTTEHPSKGKSTSPRGTLGSSVVGLPNLKVGGPTSNLTKVNNNKLSRDDMNLTNNLGKTFQQSSPKAGKEDENTTD